MKVLFLCTGNSCRSQMAEAFARIYPREGCEVYSAGIRPQGIHPLTHRSMAERGISLAEQQSEDLSGIPVKELDLVISLCPNAREEMPESLKGIPHRHWPLEDPAHVEGSPEEVLGEFARIRDDIERRVVQLFSETAS